MLNIGEFRPTVEEDLRLIDLVDRFDRSPMSEVEAYGQRAVVGSLLPRRLQLMLSDFRDDPTANAFVVRGLPIGGMGEIATPSDPIKAPREVRGFQMLALSILNRIATPFAYATQHEGRLFNNIAPSEAAESTANLGIGSKYAFDFHTEDAFMKWPPSILQLACIRNPTRTGTVLSGMPDSLSDEIKQILQRPLFCVGTNPAQADWDKVDHGPILWGDGAWRIMRFNEVNTTIREGADSETASAAFTQLREMIVADSQEVICEAGDVLLVNNYLSCHARKAFDARFDGSDRWLQRIVGYKDPMVVGDLTSWAGYPILNPR